MGIFSKKTAQTVENAEKCYKYGGIFAKVTGERTFMKSWVDKEGNFKTASIELQTQTTDEVFADPLWKPISATDYHKFVEKYTLPSVHGATERPIKLVAEIAGRSFYQFVNPTDYPAGRYREMELIFIEYQARADRNYFRDTYDAILKVINDNLNGINIGKVSRIAQDAISRIDLTFDFSLYEKLASAWYFDENEDVSCYDPEYNRQKIEFWRENGGMDFFLKLPIAEFTNLGELSTQDLQAFIGKMEVQKKLIEGSLKEILTQSHS